MTTGWPMFLGLWLAASVEVVTGLAACGSDRESDATGGDAGAGILDGGNDGGTIGFGDGAVAPNGSNYTCPGCPTFPAADAPPCAPAQLGPPSLAYPTDGLLLPPNMNVLEVQFAKPEQATLFEVDFENSITDVRVEAQCKAVPDVRGGPTRGCGVTLSQAQWNDIANKNRDGDPVRVFVRATDDRAACVSVSQASISVAFAKDDLAGGIYYWQSATFGGVGGKTGGIYSHDFGTFDPAPTPFYTSGATGTCVGCHNMSRDGARMSLATDDPDGDDEFGDVHTHMMDVATRTVIGGSTMSPGFQAWTHDHAKMLATTFKGGKDQSFAVFDGTAATLLGTIALPGGVAATQPDLSKDDGHLVFVVPAAGTISSAGDHHFKKGALWASTIDLAGLTLGAPVSLLSDAAQNFYYPSFSPDGAWIVFNEAPDAPDTAASNGDAFYNRGARVKLLHYPPAAGAQPIDLPALNVADGLTNSWPRWSPFPSSYHGKKILWVAFSSNRDYGLHLANKGFDNCYPPEGPAYDQPQPLSKQGVTYGNCAQPQIWMAAVVVDPDPALDAKDRSFPAFWLPFQDVTAHNHSAQWVEKVLAPPAGGDDGGACLPAGATCGAGSGVCCSDTVCCGTCLTSCIK